MPDDPDPQAALETLAAALDPSQFTIVTQRTGTRPARLRVVSRAASRLTEDIYAGRGYYWWSWAERISPTTDPAAAAAKITQVLHTTAARGELR